MAVYAYFSVVFTYEESSAVNIGSMTTPVITSEGGTNLDLYVDVKSMTDDLANTEEPLFTTELLNPLNITLTSSGYTGGIACDFSVFYEPTTVYYASYYNTNALSKEFVISLYAEDGETLLVDEYDLNNVEEKVYLYESVISGYALEDDVTLNYYINIGYYNQSFDQSDNSGRTFGGNVGIEVDLSSCTYWFE